MAVRGIRGANSADANSSEAILRATRTLLSSLAEANGFALDDLAAVQLSVTSDLDADFPARAARELGWTAVPLLCSKEIDVPGAPPRIIRALLLWNTDQPQAAVQHVYLGEARCLRPDLNQGKRP
ncbi:MAG: chorismate mutase [Planctomycetes bacterium]|nr:chorismate mutase [Planctomycetota bacterium]